MQSKSLYIGQLDSLRFFAFLAVFLHHFPNLANSIVSDKIHFRGWVGVEMFFVISSFLFFYLFEAEAARKREINIPKFYLRRILRLYPLMVLFPVAMLLIYGNQNGLGWYRVLGLALFVDNFLCWVRSYNVAVDFTAHLWTLSFEFQIYMIIPLAFIIYRKIGRPAFLITLGGLAVYGFLVRIAFYRIGTPHPIVWVTPFLQPDSIIAGIALAVYRPKWHWTLSLAGALVTGAVFFLVSRPIIFPMPAVYVYPLVAIMCAGLVDCAIRSPILSFLLSGWLLRALGTISFGLYVYHLLCIHLAQIVVADMAIADPALAYWLTFATSLILTTIAASASYWIVEKPFLRLKERITIVSGRPGGKPSSMAIYDSSPSPSSSS